MVFHLPGSSDNYVIAGHIQERAALEFLVVDFEITNGSPEFGAPVLEASVRSRLIFEFF